MKLQHIINILICIATFIILTIIVFIRVFTIKPTLSLALENIVEHLFLFKMCFFIALSYFIFLIIVQLLIINLNFYKKEPAKFMLNFTFWFNKLNIFYKIYVILFNYLGPQYTRHLVALAKNVLTWSSTKTKFIIFSFVSLPRVIVILILVLEVYLQALHYYFYSLLLLLIPLLFKIVVFILKDIGPRLLPELREYLDFGNSKKDTIDLNTNEGKVKVKIIPIQLKPEYTDMNLDKFLTLFYYPMLFIEGEMEVNFIPIYVKINLISLLLYWGMQILVWGYILYFYF